MFREPIDDVVGIVDRNMIDEEARDNFMAAVFDQLIFGLCIDCNVFQSDLEFVLANVREHFLRVRAAGWIIKSDFFEGGIIRIDETLE